MVGTKSEVYFTSYVSVVMSEWK